MANEKITIVVNAKDKASRVLGRITGAIGGLAALGATAAFAAIGTGIAAIGAGLVASVTKAADFEAAMDRVVALTGLTGTAAEEANTKLSSLSKELGATTAFTAKEAAEGMQFLAMAGFEVNDIAAAMPGLLSTASAGQLDLATTSDIVSNVLGGFGIEATETGRVADVLTKTFTSSNTSLTSLGDSLKFAAPIARNMGFSIEETAAAVGKMGDSGIQGTLAGTAIRGAFLALAGPSDKAAGLMKELGIEVSDSAGNMFGMEQILANVNNGLAGLSEQQRNAALKTLVGKNAISGFSVLLQSMADGSLPKLTEELRNSGGAAEEVATQQLDNLKGSFTLFKSALDGVFIGVGESLQAPLRSVVDTATQTLGRIGPSLSGMMSSIVSGDLTGALAHMAGLFQQLGIPPEVTTQVQQFAVGAVQQFEQFRQKLSEVGGPALDSIGNSVNRIKDALNIDPSTGIVDVLLGITGAVSDATITGIQLTAIAIEQIASAIETAAGLTSQINDIANALSNLSGAQAVEGIARGVFGEGAGNAVAATQSFLGPNQGLGLGGIQINMDGQQVGAITGGHQASQAQSVAGMGGTVSQ